MGFSDLIKVLSVSNPSDRSWDVIATRLHEFEIEGGQERIALALEQINERSRQELQESRKREEESRKREEESRKREEESQRKANQEALRRAALPKCPACAAPQEQRAVRCAGCGAQLLWFTGQPFTEGSAMQMLSTPESLLGYGVAQQLPEILEGVRSRLKAAVQACAKQGLDGTLVAAKSVLGDPGSSAAARKAALEMINALDAARLARANYDGFVSQVRGFATQAGREPLLPASLEKSRSGLDAFVKEIAPSDSAQEPIGPLSLLLDSLAWVAVADRRVTSNEAAVIVSVLSEQGFEGDRGLLAKEAISACKRLHSEGIANAMTRLLGLLRPLVNTAFVRLVRDLQEKVMRSDGRPKPDVEDLCTRLWRSLEEPAMTTERKDDEAIDLGMVDDG